MTDGARNRTRWVTESGDGHSQQYLDRFRRLAAEGADLAGEARLVDAMVACESRILDAGCGSGRVGAELAARGHRVVGVDLDPTLIEAAQSDHPGAQWLVRDLADLELASLGGAPFDAAVLAGNVLLYVAPDTEAAVLARVASCVRTDGIVVTGFGLGRGYDIAELDADASLAGLVLEHRFATWDLRPFGAEASFAVTVFRRMDRAPHN
jgi:SAM-dependent methyltransferase